MRIENEMLSRFGNLEHQAVSMNEKSLSSELDFFFDNVLDTVVEYFTDKELVNVRWFKNRFTPPPKKVSKEFSLDIFLIY